MAAVDEGWTHARRTIVVSDTVNLVAAVVLYFLAVGGVQGFAFTLGVTTVVDLAIIILFTHLRMITRSTGWLGFMFGVPIAAGNLFLGTFSLNMGIWVLPAPRPAGTFRRDTGILLVPPTGLEPATIGLEGRCSIH